MKPWNFALQRQHWYRAIRSMSSENAKRQRVSPLTMLAPKRSGWQLALAIKTGN